MQALQVIQRSLKLNDIHTPVPGPRQALLKMNRAGICNTDLEILRGYHNFSGTLGHEFVATVVTATDSDLVGRRVVSDINIACGNCRMCKQNNPHHCYRRSTLGINHHDGAFADYLLCPEDNLVFVPGQLPDDVAVFAEPVAASLQILEQVNIRQAQDVAVIGDGKLGLLISMCLAARGCRVSLVGRHSRKLSLVEPFGVRTMLQAPRADFPLVVEASGNPDGFRDALRLTRPGGTLVLKSTYAANLELDASTIVVNEITLLGSRCGPMQKAMDLLASGKINPRILIEQEYPLEAAVEAIAHAGRKGSLKILLRPE